MKRTIIISLIAMTTAANAQVYRAGSNNYGYDVNTYADMDYRRQSVNIQNLQTGQYQDVSLKPTYNGGYRGSDINLQTGKMFDIEVDRYGNTEIWEY